MAILRLSRKKNSRKKVGRHFVAGEFACHDGSDLILVSEETVKLLDEIREHFGLPVVITSGYRSPAHNRRVGGAKKSQHLTGRAADFYILKNRDTGERIDPRKVYTMIHRGEIFGQHNGGLGSYSNFTHIDTRPYRARWRGR